MNQFETHTETIICPECQAEQEATVEHRMPWWSYVHICTCGYIIMESEWNNKTESNESITPES